MGTKRVVGLDDISWSVVMAVLSEGRSAITDIDYARHRLKSIPPKHLTIIKNRPDHAKDFAAYQKWRRTCERYGIVPS